MATIYTKRCTHCKEEKPATEFRFHAETRDRLQSWCRACQYAYNRAYDRLMYRESPAYRQRKIEDAQRRRDCERAARVETGWTPYEGCGEKPWEIDRLIVISEGRNAAIEANGCSAFPRV